MLDVCVSNNSNMRDRAYLEGVLPDAVNLVNDLHVAGQQLAHDLDRPLLQSLRHHCVVGEGQSLRCKFKHSWPSEQVNVFEIQIWSCFS